VTDVGIACFHAGMARHAAADGASSHPLVEEALRRHRHAGGGAHRGERLPGREGPVGWPGPDHGDERTAPIGWPGGLPGSPDAEHPEGEEPAADDAEPEPPRRRRRLVGRSAAA
jgi:hypothetical protein